MYHTCVTILMGENMKNEVVHARVQESVKKDSEKILSRVGISISQAIDLFLRQVILKRGIPFDLTEEENIECDQMEELSYIINFVDGKEPPTWAKKIIHLYSRGEIDYDTAVYAITKHYQQNESYSSKIH